MLINIYERFSDKAPSWLWVLPISPFSDTGGKVDPNNSGGLEAVVVLPLNSRGFIPLKSGDPAKDLQPLMPCTPHPWRRTQGRTEPAGTRLSNVPTMTIVAAVLHTSRGSQVPVNLGMIGSTLA